MPYQKYLEIVKHARAKDVMTVQSNDEIIAWEAPDGSGTGLVSLLSRWTRKKKQTKQNTQKQKKKPKKKKKNKKNKQKKKKKTTKKKRLNKNKHIIESRIV